MRVTRIVVLLCLTGAGRLLAGPPEGVITVAEHADNVYTLNWSPDGRWLASASGDRTAVLWPMPDDESTAAGKPIVLKHDGPVYSVVFRPDGTQVATCDGSGAVSLWSLEGQLQQQRTDHADAVYAVAFSPDGRSLASGGGGGNGGDTDGRLWQVSDLTVIRHFQGHTRAIYGIAFSPDGRYLVTASSDRSVLLHDIAGENNVELTGHTSDVYRCEFSPDGRLLVTASQDRSVRVWDVQTRKQVATLDASRDPVYCVSFLRDGSLLAAAGDDCRVRIWKTSSSYPLLGEQKLARQALYGLAISPDGKQAAFAGADRTVNRIALPLPAPTAR